MLGDSVMTNVSAVTQVGDIKAVLRRASDVTGTDFDYLLRTAERESSLRPHVKASTSSATGLFQFIDQTWLATLKTAGHQYGYGNYADAIERTPDGRHKVSDPELRQEILALRKDPMASSLMAGAYTRDAAERLTDALGRSPIKGELYVAHFLGPGGAIKLIKAAQATPDKAAADLFPRAARANRPAFYERNGDERTVKDLYTKLIATYGPGRAEFAGIRPPDAREIQAAAATPPTPPLDGAAKIEPVAAHFRLSSHFQKIQPDPQGATVGRPFQSLFTTAAVRPPDAADKPARTGPLMLIPESVRAGTTPTPVVNPSAKDGAILARPDGGPMNIIPRAPVGLLQKHAPMYNLFRTVSDEG